MKSASMGAKQVEHHAGRGVELLARLGYAAKGIVYLLIGFFALQAAFGVGSPNVNQSTVFQKILTQPGGPVFLWIIAIGLFGYALWRLVEALIDPERESNGKDGLLRRVGYFFSAIIYGAFGYTAYQLVNGHSSGSAGSGSLQNWTAKLMGAPAGRWLLVLIGLVILGVGVYAFYMALTNKFEKRFKWNQMKGIEKENAIRLGKAGNIARGVVEVILGIFLIQAALTYNPSKAGGLGEALQALASQPYGPWILGLVALGLMAYGMYALLLARYRRINV